MPCRVTRLGELTLVSCSRRVDAPRCRCGLDGAVRCAYELRGAKAGQTCGAVLCGRCAQRVGAGDFCRVHAELMRAATVG